MVGLVPVPTPIPLPPVRPLSRFEAVRIPLTVRLLVKVASPEAVRPLVIDSPWRRLVGRLKRMVSEGEEVEAERMAPWLSIDFATKSGAFFF